MTDINNILKDLISQSDNYFTTTKPIPQEELNRLTGAPTKLEPLSSPSQGWQCPVCGAVMSPWASVCVNCHGNWHYTHQVTCTGSDQASCGQTITTTTSYN